MKIEVETKYEAGDYVYTERNHRMVKLYIEKVETLFPIDNDIQISYLISGDGAYGPIEHVREDELERYFRRNPEEAAKMIANNYLENFNYSEECKKENHEN